jgi:hypothetical protein
MRLHGAATFYDNTNGVSTEKTTWIVPQPLLEQMSVELNA